MKRKITSLENMLGEQMVQQAMDMVDRQITEEREISPKDVFDMDFKVEFDKSLLIMLPLLWMILLMLFLKGFAKDLYNAYQKGALFDISQYSTLHMVLMALALFVVIVGSMYFILCSIKPMPRIHNSCMIYRKKKYHFSEITKLVVSSKWNMTKIYINGKYKFWLSPDYINYRKFINWAEKCNIPIKGDKEIKKVNLENFSVNEKFVFLIILIVSIIMIGFAIALPVITYLNM